MFLYDFNIVELDQRICLEFLEFLCILSIYH